MKKIIYLILFCNSQVFTQPTIGPLTVEKIMRDPTWIGTSPSGLQWDRAGTALYFRWNPDKAETDSLYAYRHGLDKPYKLNGQQRSRMLTEDEVTYSKVRSMWTYSNHNNIYFQHSDQTNAILVCKTEEAEHNPVFSFNETAIVYTKGDNMFAWNIAEGSTIQLTNFIRASIPKSIKKDNAQELWLKSDQLKIFEILAERKRKKDLADSMNLIYRTWHDPKPLKPIYIDDKTITGQQISPDGRYVTYKLISVSRGKSTVVPNYVTESGFTDLINARTKVGQPDSPQELMIYDRLEDTAYSSTIKTLQGITNIPTFYDDYPEAKKAMQKDSAVRSVTFSALAYSPHLNHAMVDIRSLDNKDRWICTLNLANGKLHTIDRQHDEAWIGGPGIGGRFGGGNTGWINDDLLWYQSEQTGYTHLYTYQLSSQKKNSLTQGNFEVQRATLSKDKTTFYLTTNQVHPGEQQFYHLKVATGELTRITTMTGAHQVSVSPDENTVAYLYSYSNKPWELYVQENKPATQPRQVTQLARSEEFKSYAWRDPQLTSFTARDGAQVYARIYKPTAKVNNKAAVVFVHGAGYLQNAHKWWSSYFREYMFHNMLVDLGYTVLDIDYRGSAGYGRDWRTGIYRHMGGKDLTDHVDAAKYLIEHHGVHAKKIGIYGGSYGGFITLMGLFTTPEVFAAGAALRPVTDWAQYNHPYTANILNEPVNDSIAYKKSSPFYYAEGLKKPLLICHGMVDVNVHYQDAVKLAQRLIELKKDNWELASYPMEDHGFVEPSSWTDEYKRILKLFQQWLK